MEISDVHSNRCIVEVNDSRKLRESLDVVGLDVSKFPCSTSRSLSPALSGGTWLLVNRQGSCSKSVSASPKVCAREWHSRLYQKVHTSCSKKLCSSVVPCIWELGREHAHELKDLVRSPTSCPSCAAGASRPIFFA